MKYTAWLLALVSALSTSAISQNSTPLITGAINEGTLVTLHGNVHPLAQPRYDLGTVPDSFPASRMVLLLQRSPEREAALQQFLQDAHRPGSPTFHKWLKPDQVGARYGLPDTEIATVCGWLEEHGSAVSRINRAKTAIELSGTAGEVR